METREVVLLHDNLIRDYGGASGILSLANLEMSLARPFVGLADGTQVFPSTIEKAAALFEGVIKYHPFLDGNKRTAANLLVLFLGERGLAIHFEDDEIVDLCIGVAESNIGYPQLVEWIRLHLPRSQP